MRVLKSNTHRITSSNAHLIENVRSEYQDLICTGKKNKNNKINVKAVITLEKIKLKKMLKKHKKVKVNVNIQRLGTY